MHSSPSSSNPKDRLASLLEQLPKWEASSFSPLEVPRAIAAELGNPQDAFRSIHVAGTNGKGSVCAFLAATLRESGLRVGQFVSPHLSDVTERCLIGGVPVETKQFADAIEQVLDAAKRLECAPSFFVVTMLATFLVFAERDLEWGVVEVGLGGRFDATSILSKPEISIITKIGYDHMHWLGDTLEEIAGNKAGIIKPGVPVLVAENEEAALEVCRSVAREQQAPYYEIGQDFHLDRTTSELIYGEHRVALGLDSLMRQTFFAENRAVGIAAAMLLQLCPNAIARATRTVRWPGRCEILNVERVIEGTLSATSTQQRKRLQVILDGLHNPQGAEAFLEFLRAYLRENGENKVERMYVVLSLRSTKNVQGVIEILQEGAPLDTSGNRIKTHYICTGDDITLATPSKELSELIQCDSNTSAIAVPVALEALEMSLSEASEQDLILVIGSLYLIGALRPHLVREGFTTVAEEACSPTSVTT